MAKRHRVQPIRPAPNPPVSVSGNDWIINKAWSVREIAHALVVLYGQNAKIQLKWLTEKYPFEFHS